MVSLHASRHTHRGHGRIDEAGAEVQLPAVRVRVVLLVADPEHVHVVSHREGARVRRDGGRDGDAGQGSGVQVPPGPGW